MQCIIDSSAPFVMPNIIFIGRLMLMGDDSYYQRFFIAYSVVTKCYKKYDLRI